jgi:hypothetical protein
VSKSDDNHTNQMNPNNDSYWQSRGWDESPEDWDEQSSKQDEERKVER